MSDIKNKLHILEAIDHLRARKARPDASRICKFLQKFYKVTPTETKTDLRRCLKDKIVIKVEYKNNVSYRNAAIWRRERQKKKILPESEKKMAASVRNEHNIIVTALATLIYQNENYLEKGVPIEELTRTAMFISSKHTRKQLESIINKGLASNSLISLANGNLALGSGDQDADSVDSTKSENYGQKIKHVTSSANSSCSSPQRTRGRPRKGSIPFSHSHNKSKPPSAAVRVGERRKMAKKVFDPSDNNPPIKRKRGRPLGSVNKHTIESRRRKANSSTKSDNTDTPPGSQNSDDISGDEEQDETNYEESSGGVCTVCLVQKSRGSNDRFIECKDCSNKAHYNCIQSESGMLKLRPDNTWQCPHCKACVACCETNDAGVLTVCSVCSDAYHALCHTPRIPERLKAWDQWECSNCLESRPRVAGSPSLGPSNSITIEAFLRPHECDLSKSKKTDIPIDPKIPDISNWTSEDVYEYFLEHFAEAAQVLRDQDFDGQALKVARRRDIVKGLGLPLGLALRTYRIVVKLQTRKDDFTMCWG